MKTAGRGEYRAEITSKQYISAPPVAISNLEALNGNTAIQVSWDANTEPDIDGYFVYYSVWNADPTLWSFTKRAKVTAATDTVTGLVNGTSYVFYVTAVNYDGTEAPRSLPVSHAPTAGGATTIYDYTQWVVDVESPMPTKDGSADVTIALECNHTFMCVKPDSYVISVKGPSADDPPPYVCEQLTIVPTAIDSTEIIYRRHALTEFVSGTAFYERGFLHRVTINGLQYEAGTAVPGNQDGTTWPTYP
jgi:hypothetical protein